MDYLTAFAISAAGMGAEKLRTDVVALNLANANTALGAGGSGYQPLRVVTAAPLMGADFGQMMDRGLAALQSASVAPYAAPNRKVYEPGHPKADREGYVSYPGVDSLMEMMTLMTASRAYEANVAAFNIARTMTARALEIGGRG